jgi:hypothetical protein
MELSISAKQLAKSLAPKETVEKLNELLEGTAYKARMRTIGLHGTPMKQVVINGLESECVSTLAIKIFGNNVVFYPYYKKGMGSAMAKELGEGKVPLTKANLVKQFKKYESMSISASSEDAIDAEKPKFNIRLKIPHTMSALFSKATTKMGINYTLRVRGVHNDPNGLSINELFKLMEACVKAVKPYVDFSDAVVSRISWDGPISGVEVVFSKIVEND